VPKTKTISFRLSESESNTDLSAQLIRYDGLNITSFISDGFVDIGNGFYSWNYTNFPENFQGGVKFYKSTDLTRIVHFVGIEIDGENICSSCGTCDTSYGDTFAITYSDISAANFYALLFSASDLTKVFNTNTNNFIEYSLSQHANVSIKLVENTNRLGYYEYVIENTENIPKVVGDQYYFIEVWQQIGDAPNRSQDINVGNLKVCWGSEVNMWDNVAKQVWEYSERTLTQDFTTDLAALEKTILAAIASSTGKTIEELNSVETNLGDAIQKTFNLLQICCGQQGGVVPRAQILPGNFTPSSPPIRIT
jgi:hypothetical protein